MEKEILKDWIERFFAAELTMDEECELYRYLCENEVPTELRKDKEAIIALCGEPEEVELPEGAAQRLEAMLDELEEMQTRLNPPCEEGAEGTHPRYSLPPRKGWGAFLLRAACVAGVAVALFLALPNSKDTLMLAEVYEEEDTFSTPEEAYAQAHDALMQFALALEKGAQQIAMVHSTTEKIEENISEYLTLTIE